MRRFYVYLTLILADAYQKCLSRSFIISSDVSHAYNPNYPVYYQKDHKLNSQNGVVLSTSINGSMTTDCEGSAIVKALASLAKIPLQVRY